MLDGAILTVLFMADGYVWPERAPDWRGSHFARRHQTRPHPVWVCYRAL